jgi:hypothetical protein
MYVCMYGLGLVGGLAFCELVCMYGLGLVGGLAFCE